MVAYSGLCIYPVDINLYTTNILYTEYILVYFEVYTELHIFIRFVFASESVGSIGVDWSYC